MLSASCFSFPFLLFALLDFSISLARESIEKMRHKLKRISLVRKRDTIICLKFLLARDCSVNIKCQSLWELIVFFFFSHKSSIWWWSKKRHVSARPPDCQYWGTNQQSFLPVPSCQNQCHLWGLLYVLCRLLLFQLRNSWAASFSMAFNGSFLCLVFSLVLLVLWFLSSWALPWCFLGWAEILAFQAY